MRYRILGAAALAVLLPVGAQASAAQTPPRTAANVQAWHTTISKLPRPSAGACFTAKYPRQAWVEAECSTPPAIPMVPKPAGPRPLIIGNGNDISAMAPSGTILEATGSFENVMNVTSVHSPIGNVGPPVNDAYTLQLNTNYFVTTACAGSPNPGCQGWEQFVFADDGTSGMVFIQYWLLRYNDPCPADWYSFQFTGDSDIYCYRNSPTAVVTPHQPITNLANLTLSGHVSLAGDSVTLFDAATATSYSAVGPNFLDTRNGWTAAEFNVFGFGGNSDGGGMATFNAGASVNVRTRINYGGIAPPICVAQGFTGETNNLLFGTPAPPATPPWTSVVFLQNTVGGAVSNCAAAAVVGDTHQKTFSGLAYDFQASGDFVEATVDGDFEVQTRKVSGAPSWPGTSVNQSVATRMGSTKVALCEGKRLVVDGRARQLEPGGVLALPSGVTIHRLGNVYIVTDEKGNSIRATAHSVYMDVRVGLGTWPATVRGLLGNPGNDPRVLEAKDGTRFTAPFSFEDLYRKFGDSWRVSPLRTLLAPCSQVAVGNPAAPFYASDLKPDLRERARGICLQARVPQAWLDFCTLDVAVIGDTAAQAFVGLEPPVVNGNP